MATTKNYLDYDGLKKYDELLKNFVKGTYVAQEAGKSLMTDAQATKLAGIAEGAQVNVIESISVKGNGGGVTTPTVTDDKGVTIDISAYALSSEVTAEAKRAGTAESSLDAKIDRIFTPAHDTTPATGSVVTYVNKKIEAVNSAASTLSSKVIANENAIKILNGNAETSGSVAHTVSTEITKLVNGAPAAFNTLKEIADWIGEGAQNTTAASMLADINTLKGTGEGSVKKALQDAKDYTDAEKTRAEGEEGKLARRLTVVEGEGEGSIKKALQDAKSYTDVKIGTIPGQVGETATATVVVYVDAKVAAEQKRASDAESALDTRLDAIETSLGDTSQSMSKRVTALETTVGDSNSGLVKGVADNKAAIAAADGRIDGVITAYQAADTALQAAINAIGAIPLEGANSIASLFPAA